MNFKLLQKQVPRSLQIALLIASSMVYALILFFIDENRYSLNGIFSPENLPALGFYILIMIGSTILIYQILKKLIVKNLAELISIIIGPILGILTFFGAIFLISNIT